MRADAGSGAKAPVTENADGTAIVPADTQDSWIVGSDQMSRDWNDSTKDHRAFFNKAKGAFRAGVNNDADWDDANIGWASSGLGFNSEASSEGAHAEGYGCTAKGTGSHAEGYGTTAQGQYTHAEGQQTSASGTLGTHAEGYKTLASGNYGAHAEGRSTTASGASSHAEGEYTTASGQVAHAEGAWGIASGSFSHVEGVNGRASRYGESAKASGFFGTQGDAQSSHMVFRRQTSDAIAALMTADSSAPTTTGSNTNVWTLLTNRAHKVRIEAIARRTDIEGEAAGFTWEGVVVRDAGAPRIVGDPFEIVWGDVGTETWNMAVGINATDAANPYLEILVTGEAGKTIRWVAGLYVTEVG